MATPTTPIEVAGRQSAIFPWLWINPGFGVNMQAFTTGFHGATGGCFMHNFGMVLQEVID
jgi:hypothetical protein